MSFIVFCTFDLKGASAQDYSNAYADLARLGLSRVHKNDGGGNTVIPTTAAMGEFNSANAAAARDDLRAKIRAAFVARGFRSEIFVIVGGQDWGWGSATT